MIGDFDFLCKNYYDEIMAITLDDITRKKIILVRQLFEKAVSQAEMQYNYVNAMMALIGFDLSNETALKTIISALNSKPNPDGHFHKVIQTANEELKKVRLNDLPIEDKIRYIHDLRNDAQHRATYPNESVLSDCRTYTQDFLKQVIQNVWGVDFESISFVDVIQNSEVKNLLIKASEKLKQEDYTNSAFDSVAAFQITIGSVKNSIVGSMKPRAFTHSSSEFTEIKNTLNEIDELRNLLMYSIIGLDFRSFTKYTRITSTTFIGYLGDGKYSGAIGRADYTQSEAEFVFNFVINSVVQIESLVGDSSKPFNISI